MTMRRTPLFALIVFSTVALTHAAPVLAQAANPSVPVVIASGERRIRVAPDQAWVTVSVDTRDAKAPEARRLGAAAMTTVSAALKKTGLDNDAIQTIGFSLQPDYEFVNGRQRLKGFVVSNQVQVRIDEVSRVADVLDAVGGLSLPASSMATLAGLRFDLKNRANVEREALKGAVEDALARARFMASGAGLNLGRTLRIEEAGGEAVPKFQPVMMARSGAMAESVATPISAADIEIRAQIVLTIEVK